jgi:hypothetical protein
MAISNNTTGLRPGVCTSTTRPSAPYEGQMIYETDTNRVLVWDNAAWVMIADTDTPPGLQLIKTQAVGSSSVSNVTVADAFSAEYDHYVITYTGGTLSGLADIAFYFGSTRPANGYSQSQIFTRYDIGTSGVSTVNNGTEWTFAGGGDTSGTFVNLQIMNPFNSGVSKYFTYQGLIGPFTVSGTGIFTATGSQTAFTLDPSGTTTMVNGTIRVYGYRK